MASSSTGGQKAPNSITSETLKQHMTLMHNVLLDLEKISAYEPPSLPGYFPQMLKSLNQFVSEYEESVTGSKALAPIF